QEPRQGDGADPEGAVLEELAAGERVHGKFSGKSVHVQEAVATQQRLAEGGQRAGLGGRRLGGFRRGRLGGGLALRTGRRHRSAVAPSQTSSTPSGLDRRTWT